MFTHGIGAKPDKGFTLVELMVVITIMGVLAAVIISSFSQARLQERVAKRVSDMKQVQAALALYYSVNHSYPITPGGWRSVCATWGGYSANNVIPGLAPTYIPAVPTDPQTDAANNLNCYVYMSLDGTEYAFLDNDVKEMEVPAGTTGSYANYPELVDPARDSGSNLNVVDGTGIWAWKVSTPGMVGS